MMASVSMIYLQAHSNFKRIQPTLPISAKLYHSCTVYCSCTTYYYSQLSQSLQNCIVPAPFIIPVLFIVPAPLIIAVPFTVPAPLCLACRILRSFARFYSRYLIDSPFTFICRSTLGT
ncbi:hypothetical protein L208DRAFT_717752 [Tricholoma matsutake]|nr:hypothetical protein L208DRAFT_717752 [Tricholoma matsutake 945]